MQDTEELIATPEDFRAFEDLLAHKAPWRKLDFKDQWCFVIRVAIHYARRVEELERLLGGAKSMIGEGHKFYDAGRERITDLESQLAAANARVAELEKALMLKGL